MIHSDVLSVTSKCVGEGSPSKLVSGLSEDSERREPPTGRLISLDAFPVTANNTEK